MTKLLGCLVFNSWFLTSLNPSYVCSLYSNTTTPLFTLNNVFLNNNLWNFFQNIVFTNQGLLTNNVTNSYTSYCLRKNYRYGKPWFPSKNALLIKNHLSLVYFKNILILNFSFLKKYFKRSILIIFFFTMLPNIGFLNIFKITHSFVILQKLLYLTPFYSTFYFKVHNF